ncbi:hypothetical protein HAX54_015022 [Datura stramonium]|uniref:MINDY deubiquitinase domain-containing protein n=1 Tax=Datura stramonium TaxID=4076 RepID=A0ABS8S1H7_DATST|nr:hypothetical protein [Datura stramonium]
MFKFEGELYILATDQGFINQPDLVWEKFNECPESIKFGTPTVALPGLLYLTFACLAAFIKGQTVNGDTIYVTGNFKEFKVEDTANTTWDQQSAMASTADYLANMDNSRTKDIQLSTLQQQEFEQQQQAFPRNQNPQQPAVNGGSRLITGPQFQGPALRPMSSSPKTEPKSSKDLSEM